MKFVLYTLNYEPELTGIGKYNGDLIRGLDARGVESSVVTAVPYYPEWKVHKGFVNVWSKEHCDGVCVYRNPLYVPKTVTTLRRLLHLCSFAISSIVSLLRLLKVRPDVIMVVQPTLFCVPGALIFSYLTGAKSVMHIQDFEVDAMLGLGMGRQSGLLLSLIHKVESWLMRRFDMVSTISFSMLNSAKGKGVTEDKLLFFPNWANTDFITPMVDGSAFRLSWGVLPDEKVVLYSGNIGKKQGLELVVDAAVFFSRNPKIKFFLVGSGAFVDELKALVADKGLSNIIFKPLQAWEDVPAMLSMADVHLVIQKKGAADAVLPSKLTNILSAGGNTIVTAEPDTELGRLESQYPGIYRCVEPENLSAFCEGLALELNKPKKVINTVARQYAENNLNKEAVIDRFLSEVSKILID